LSPRLVSQLTDCVGGCEPGSTILVKKIKDDLARHNFSAQAVGRAIDNLIGHQAFEWMAMQKKIRRIA
jgi:hypothetical protein